MKPALLATLLIISACVERRSDGLRHLAADQHFSVIRPKEWSESRDLGSLVWKSGKTTIAVRYAERGDPAELVANTERVLRALPGAQVSAPTRVEVAGFEAVAFDLVFRPERAGGHRYARRHFVLSGRSHAFHLLHTSPEGTLEATSAVFARFVTSFREEA